MKILVTGSNGLVGSYVVQQLLMDGHEVFASSRTADLSSFTAPNYRFVQMNFTDPFALHDAFAFIQPDAVVHCGAMSKPDDCEENQADAYDTNVVSTVQLLLNAAEYKSFFIFLSTDFIFNGKEGLHTETDEPSPISYYGQTKLEAEQAVQGYANGWAIVRTVFVYGKPLYGRDCFITMVSKKLKNNEPYKVVNDQERTPTYAADLANAIGIIIKKKTAGIFNVCGKNVLTPYEMTLMAADFLKIQSSHIAPVSSVELKELAKRPLKSGLNINKAIKELAYNPLSFEDGLRKTLATDVNG